MAQGYRYNPDTVTFDPIEKGGTEDSRPLRYPKAALDNMDYLRIQVYKYEKQVYLFQMLQLLQN